MLFLKCEYFNLVLPCLSAKYFITNNMSAIRQNTDEDVAPTENNVIIDKIKKASSASFIPVLLRISVVSSDFFGRGLIGNKL